MNLTEMDTMVLPRPLPSYSNLSPFLYESVGGSKKQKQSKRRQSKKRATAKRDKKRSDKKRSDKKRSEKRRNKKRSE